MDISHVLREKFLDALYFEKQLNQCFFTETEIYERLVFQYAQHLYHYKKEKDCKAIIEMRKCIGAMKLAGSTHLAKNYEGHLEKILAEKG